MNNYHLYEEIGHGKHSTIYKGRRRFTIHYLAIKSIDKTKRSRVLNEFSIANDVLDSISEPSLCGVFEWHETRNHLWIVSEYCAGGDLVRVLKQDGCIQPENQAGIFFAQMARALLVMHAKGVVFADMKPGNVLFTETGAIKLGGFGVAQKVSDIEAALAVNIAAPNLPRRGSPFYMAPELFEDSGFHSISSDIYGLGCVLCELVSGKTPYSNCASFSQLCGEINNSDQPDLPTSISRSSALYDLLVRMLAKHPAQRILWQDILAHPWVQNQGVSDLDYLAKKTAPVESRFLSKYFQKTLRPHAYTRKRRDSSIDETAAMSACAADNTPTGAAAAVRVLFRE